MTKTKKTERKSEMMVGARNTPEGKALAMDPWGVEHAKERVTTYHPSKTLRQKNNRGNVTSVANQEETHDK